MSFFKKITKFVGIYPSEEEIKVLIDELTDRDNKKKKTAAEKLGQIGDPRAIQPLIDAISSCGYVDVCETICRALGQMGAPAVNPLILAIKQYGSSKSDNQRKKVKWFSDALVLIGEPSVEPLVSELKNKNQEFDNLYSVIRILGDVGDKRAIPVLIDLLDNPRYQLHSAIALGNIGDKKGVDTLINILDDKDYSTRKLSARSLVDIYKKGKIDYDLKQKILSHKGRITSPHTDSRISPSDCTTEDRHEDNGGIGEYF